jgi:hypothetical protein
LDAKSNDSKEVKMNIDEIVSETIADFKIDIEVVRSGNIDLVSELVAEVDGAGFEKLTDYFFDVADETKGHLGSKAANRIEDTTDQESAISAVEGWFTENISNAGSEMSILCALWGYGAEQAAAAIRTEISNLTNTASQGL